MAVQQNFRTSFNGFNREDVVHYIEYINAKHTAEINQLNSEVEFLRSKVNPEADGEMTAEQPQAELSPELQERCAALEEELAALRAENEQLTAENADLESRLNEAISIGTDIDAQLSEAAAEKEQLISRLNEAISIGTDIEKQLSETTAEKDALAAKLEAALQQQTTFESKREEELAAYRRAERAERMAKERASEMYCQATGVIADATVKVNEAADQIGALSEAVMAQLAQLQQAVAGSNAALKDAAAVMYTIRPETEE